MQSLDYSFNDDPLSQRLSQQSGVTSPYESTFNADPTPIGSGQTDTSSQQATSPVQNPADTSRTTTSTDGNRQTATATQQPTVSAYGDLLTQIGSTSDPTQQAILKDQLARSVYTTLQGAGHDVQWNGDQLMVDGRPYVIGSGSSLGAPPPPPPSPTFTGGSYIDYLTANSQNPAMQDWAQQAEAYSAAKYGQPTTLSEAGAGGGTTTSGQPGAYASALQGFDAAKLADPNKHDPKYDFARIAQNYPPTPAGLQAMAQDPAFAAAGYKYLGDDKIQVPNGSVIDVGLSFGSGGGVGWAWQPVSGPDAAQGGGAPAAGGIDMGAPNYASQVNVGGAYQAPSQQAAPQASWALTAPKYTPGDIPIDDVPNFSYDQIFGAATAPTATGQATDAAINGLLANPDSLDPATIAKMKAASKDELAQMQADRDQNLRQMGASYGIGDSPWLAGQRASAQRDYDAQLVGKNRDIEIGAATQNKADERAAAQLGASYTGQQQQLRQAAVQLASNASLQSAAARGDRMALREQVNQAATSLGLNADQLQLQYTLGLLQDATTRNGQSLDYGKAMAQLQESGREFQEDLAFRLAQLNQQDQQFGASYGLQAGQLQLQADQQAYDQYHNTFGG